MRANTGRLTPSAPAGTRPGSEPGAVGIRHNLARSPRMQGLLALAVYLAGWLSTAARPLVAHPASAQLYQSSMDPNFFVWALRWWPYAISHGLNPLYSAQVGAPAGYPLAWVTLAAPLGLVAAPITLTAGPIVAFNLLAAIAMPVSAWAAFVLCRRLTQRFWPSLAGGFVFGFSAYESAHMDAGQLDIVFSLLLPLIAYLVLLWRDEAIGSGTFICLLALAFAVQFYLFLETFADLTGVLVIALAAGYALAGRLGRPSVARLSRLVGVAYLIALALAAPYLWVALAHPAPTWTGTSVDIASLVIPGHDDTLTQTYLVHAAAVPVAETTEAYVGVPLLAIALVLAVSAWSSRLVRFLSVMLVLIIVAALGPVVHVDGRSLFTLPWARAWTLPLLRNAYPERLMVFAFLILAVMAAMWLCGPGDDPRNPRRSPPGDDPRSPRRTRPAAPWVRAGLAVLAVAAIVLNTPALTITPRNDVPALITTGEYRHYLSPGETVVVVSTVKNAGMLWQADTGFYDKLAGGYISQILTPRYDLPLAVRALTPLTPRRVRRFRTFVRAAGVGAILVDAAAQPSWASAFSKIGLTGRLVGGVWIYPTDGCRTCR